MKELESPGAMGCGGLFFSVSSECEQGEGETYMEYHGRVWWLMGG